MAKNRVKWFVLGGVLIAIVIGLVIGRCQATALISHFEFDGVRSSLIIPKNTEGLEQVKNYCRDAIGKENVQPDSDYLEVSENTGDFWYYWKNQNGTCFVTQACDGTAGGEATATKVILGRKDPEVIKAVTYEGGFLVIET